MMYLDARKWSAEEQEHARELQKDLNILTNPTVVPTRDFDYPVDEPTKGAWLPRGAHLENSFRPPHGLSRTCLPSAVAHPVKRKPTAESLLISESN